MRKVLLAIGGMAAGWLVASIVGAALLLAFIADLDLEDSVEKAVMAMTALSGIIGGGIYGARIADRSSE